MGPPVSFGAATAFKWHTGVIDGEWAHGLGLARGHRNNASVNFP